MSEPIWLGLFDTGEMSHVINLMEEWLVAQPIPEAEVYLHTSFRTILMPELQAYISDHQRHGNFIQPHVDRAYSLLSLVDAIAYRIERGEMVQADIDELEKFWRFFISDAQMEYHHGAEAARRKRTSSVGGSKSTYTAEFKEKVFKIWLMLERDGAPERNRITRIGEILDEQGEDVPSRPTLANIIRSKSK